MYQFYVYTLVSKCQSLSCARLFATPWTAAHQAPLSMRFSKQGYWSGLPFPSPGYLPNPGIEPGSPALQADSLLTELQGKPLVHGEQHLVHSGHFAAVTSVQVVNIFITPKENPLDNFPIPPPVSPGQPPIYFLSLWVYLFWTFHIDGIILYVIFCVCLLSLSIMYFQDHPHCGVYQNFVDFLWLNNTPV